LTCCGFERTGAAVEVQRRLQARLESGNHNWFIGKMSAEEHARRAKQREEFVRRYVGKPYSVREAVAGSPRAGLLAR